MSNPGNPRQIRAEQAPAGDAVPLIAAKEEFDRFYHREYPAILAMAHVMTGDRSAAQDLTQDAFIAAYQKWDTIDAPSAWVRTVVANRSKSWFRKRYREARAVLRLRAQTRTESVALGADTEHFWAEVRALPTRQAQSVALYYLEQMTAAEIGAVLGCSESTVRVHLTRGRRTLADRLEAEL